MKRWLIGTLAGLALAAGISAYAVTAGGFPSRPWLQSLGIGAPAPAISGEMKATGNIIVSGNGPADTVAYTADGVELLPVHGSMRFWSYQAPTDEKLWDSYTDTSGVLHYRMVNDADTLANDWLQVTRSGYTPQSINVVGGYLEAAGMPVDIFANVSGNSSSCSVVSGVVIYQCTRTATGLYQLSFSITLPRAPVCVASAYSGQGYTAYVDQESTTGARIVLFNSASPYTALDGLVNVICH